MRDRGPAVPAASKRYEIVIRNYCAGALALALALTACNDARSPGGQESEGRRVEASDRQVYRAEGRVTEVAEGHLTIAHGPVAELGWPAMSMSFARPSPQAARDIGVGDRVRFAFREDDGRYTLTSVDKVE